MIDLKKLMSLTLAGCFLNSLGSPHQSDNMSGALSLMTRTVSPKLLNAVKLYTNLRFSALEDYLLFKWFPSSLVSAKVLDGNRIFKTG